MHSLRRIPLLAVIAAALFGAVPSPAAAKIDPRNASCAALVDPSADANGFMADRSYGSLRVVQCSADTIGWLGYSRALPVTCPLGSAPYRGGSDNPYGAEWDYAAGDWVTWDGIGFWYGDSVRVHNWTFQSQPAFGMVACYPQPGAVPANRWYGLTPFSQQRAFARVAPLAAASVLRGDEQPDSLTGTTGPDEIAAGGGADTISAGTGHDQVWAGTGDDHANGGDGEDTLLGGAGDDGLAGGRGDDRLFDDSGRDRLNGGPGNDLFSTVDGNVDQIRCGAGRDTVMADRVDRVARDCERVRRGKPRKPRG